MDAGTKFSMKLTDGKTLEYRIIGINHDDLPERPSGVPFIEMLELPLRQSRSPRRPSGVPFIEMLEFLAVEVVLEHSPSGVPFIEMLEFIS